MSQTTKPFHLHLKSNETVKRVKLLIKTLNVETVHVIIKFSEILSIPFTNIQKKNVFFKTWGALFRFFL